MPRPRWLLPLVLALVLVPGAGSAGPQHESGPPRSDWARRATAARNLGQMIVVRFHGTVPSQSVRRRIRAGQVGGVILAGDNVSGGLAATTRLIALLQADARAAHTWPLLVMLDQEGGSTKRLAGIPPTLSAGRMSSAAEALAQGRATGRALRGVGVNVDLAPVADVAHARPSFLGSRAFGSSAAVVRQRACAFAAGLAEWGVAYTLKHFPGLGRAKTSTDYGPVTIGAPAAALRADYAAYRQCGRGPRALVMVSSAGYPALTGSSVPAVLSPAIYGRELPAAGIDAVTISDDLETAAIARYGDAPRQAVNAGLDLLLFYRSESGSDRAYGLLLAGIHAGTVDRRRITDAGHAIRRLKDALVRSG